MATYQLGHSGQTWQLPKLDGMGSTYSPHQELLPSLFLTWISWAGLSNRYVLPPRQTPPSPSHSSPWLSCLPLPFHYKSSLFPLCLGSLKLTFSAGTQDKRILVSAWWGEGGGVACWEWLMGATWVPISQQTRNARDGPHSVGIYVRATEKIYVRAPVKIGGVILVTTRPSSKWQLSKTWIVNGWQH